jgi:hypothetical protein
MAKSQGGPQKRASSVFVFSKKFRVKRNPQPAQVAAMLPSVTNTAGLRSSTTNVTLSHHRNSAMTHLAPRSTPDGTASKAVSLRKIASISYFWQFYSLTLCEDGEHTERSVQH